MVNIVISGFLEEYLITQGFHSGEAPPTREEAPSVGVYRPRIIRRPTYVDAVAVASLAIARYEVEALLLCDLLHTIVAEGLVTGELRDWVRATAVAVAENSWDVKEACVVVAPLVWELREMVRLEGRVDTLKIMMLLKMLEEL